MKIYEIKKKVLNKSDIKESLKTIADLIIDEDSANRTNHTIGEGMEYFLRHHIFETLIAYAKADKPPGFF